MSVVVGFWTGRRLINPGKEFLSLRDELARGISVEARDESVEFILSLRCDDGGFRGRGASSDLYYTFFALAVLCTLNFKFDAMEVERYLDSFDEDSSLDVVHTCCLIRCYNLLRLNEASNGTVTNVIGDLLHRKRMKRKTMVLQEMAKKTKRIYDVFLIAQTGRELGLDLVTREIMERVLNDGKRDDGGYSESNVRYGLVTVTAAAIWLTMRLDRSVNEITVDWIMKTLKKNSGFCVTIRNDLPDLLSTAAAVQAMKWAGRSIKNVAPGILTFVEECRRDNGSFGATTDSVAGDSEYLFYALSTIAHLLSN